MLSRRRSLGTILLLLLFLPALSSAQETRATVTGTVSDPQGAVVPGVTVTVLNIDTNVATEAVTNESGVFSVRQLHPGPLPGHGLAAGLQDVGPRRHHAAHGGNRHHPHHAVARRRGRERSP